MKVSFPNAASIIVRKEQTVRGAATQQHAGAGRGKIKEQSLIDFDSLEVKMNSLLEKAEQEPDGFEILNAAEARAVATAAAINEGASAALPSLLTSSEYVRGMVSNFSSPFRSGRLLQSIGGPLATTSNTSNIAVRSFDGGVVPLLPKDVEALQHPVHGSKTLQRQLQAAVKLRSAEQSDDAVVLDADSVQSKEVVIKVIEFSRLQVDDPERHASFMSNVDRRVLFPLVLAGIDLECYTLATAAKKEVTRLIEGQTIETIQNNDVAVDGEKRALQKMVLSHARQQDTTDASQIAQMRDRLSSEVGGAAADPADVQCCSWCKVAFTLTRRKHRCRICQLSYCDDCSKSRVKLDAEQIRHFEVANERGLMTRCATAAWEFSAKGRNWDPLDVRACFLCYYEHASKETFFTRIFKECKLGMKDLHLLSKLKMNSASEGPKSQMDDWSEVPQLAKDRSSWSISADGCLKDIAKLQGKLPTHTFSAMESQLLVVHASSLCTHSQYLTQLIRSFSQEGSEGKGISVLLCDLLYKCIQESALKEKELSCEEAKCRGGTCQRSLRPLDGLELLAGNPAIKHPELRCLAVEAVTSASPIELFCWLPLLVKALQDEPNMSSSKLFRFLMQRACGTDPELRHALFWELTRHSFDPNPSGRMYARCRDRLMIKLAEASEELIVGNEIADFFSRLDYRSASNDQILRKSQVELKILTDNCGRVSLPIKPGFQVKAVKSVTRLSSSQAPLVFVFSGADDDAAATVDEGAAATVVGGEQSTSSCSTLTVAYKREALTKDAIVMRVLRLIRHFFNEGGVDVQVLMYNVQCTGQEEGLIEFVPNSRILKDLYKGTEGEKGEDIRRYILANNVGREAEAMSRFARSLSAMTVIMFVLACFPFYADVRHSDDVVHLKGAGDRHDENVMIHKNGCFFHIDFGFVLGKDPKKMLLNQIGDSMPFSRKYIDAMGGKHSKYYKEFVDHAEKCYHVLRANSRVIIIMLLLLVDEDDDIERIEADFMKRFSLGSSKEDASKYLRLFIENGQWKQDVVNKLHDAPVIIQSAADTAYTATASMLRGVSGMLNAAVKWG